MKSTEGVLGAALAAARVDAGLEPEDVHQESGLSLEFIHRVEAGEYSRLPHDIYTVQEIKKLAHAIGADPEWALEQYYTERGPTASEGQLRRSHHQGSPVVTSTLLWQGSVLLVTVTVAAYIVYQLAAALGSPQLEVVSPAEHQVITSDEAELRGHTSARAEVTVDGQAVEVASDGSFNKPLDLPEGTHTVQVSAESELGRISDVERTFRIVED